MPNPVIIGLTGCAGSGKDTAAFANPLRRMVQSLIFPTPIQWQNRAWKEASLPHLGFSPRQLLQTLGTEWGRALDPGFWLKHADMEMARMLITPDGIVPCIVWTDVRFENEAAWIRAQGGQVWHLERSSAAPVAAHVSEFGITPLANEPRIDNSGTVDELYERLDGQMEKIYADWDAL